MTESFAVHSLVFLHLTALALWVGWLFGYVAVVWPAIMSEAEDTFPRALLVSIGMRTAPWIYLAMASALLSLIALWVMDAAAARQPGIAAYTLALTALVANNLYGTVVSWPRVMLLPHRYAAAEWFWFRARMAASLVVAMGLYGVALMTT
jgi:uncharacterized membrane protein